MVNHVVVTLGVSAWVQVISQAGIVVTVSVSPRELGGQFFTFPACISSHKGEGTLCDAY